MATNPQRARELWPGICVYAHDGSGLQRTAGLVDHPQRVEHAARRFLLGTRRERPSPDSTRFSAGTTHSTSKVWACAGRGGTDAVVGTGRRRACSHSCNSVLASLDQLATSVVAMISPNRTLTTERAASKPPSRNVARSAPPGVGQDRRALRAPPRASPSPGAARRQAQLHGHAVQAFFAHQVARTRVRSPSSEPANRSNSKSRSPG